MGRRPGQSFGIILLEKRRQRRILIIRSHPLPLVKESLLDAVHGCWKAMWIFVRVVVDILQNRPYGVVVGLGGIDVYGLSADVFLKHLQSILRSFHLSTRRPRITMVPSSSSIPSDCSIRSVSPSIWFARNIPHSEHFDTNDGTSSNLCLLCIILKNAVLDESNSQWRRKYWKR